MENQIISLKKIRQCSSGLSLRQKRVKHISTFNLICSGQLRKTGREFPYSESFDPNIKENVWAFRRLLIPLPTHSILPKKTS